MATTTMRECLMSISRKKKLTGHVSIQEKTELHVIMKVGPWVFKKHRLEEIWTVDGIFLMAEVEKILDSLLSKIGENFCL